MSLEIVFLGTAGSIPTVNRSLPSIAVRRMGELLIFDCGEGTQRQMITAGVGFKPKMYIFITHMHLDHISGLFGLIHTLSLLDRKQPLHIFGPRGLSRYIRLILEAIGSEEEGTDPPFQLNIHEIGEGLAHRGKDYSIYAAPADHGIPCLAYALVEDERPGRFYPERARKLGVPEGPLWAQLKKGSPISLPNGRTIKPEDVCGPKLPGRKIVYSGDTRPVKSVVKLAEGADVLIHDATFDDELEDRAYEDGHSTASQAARVAREAQVKRLFLIHISARYKDPTILLEQARRIFPNTEVAEDLMRVEVPLPREPRF